MLSGLYSTTDFVFGKGRDSAQIIKYQTLGGYANDKVSSITGDVVKETFDRAKEGQADI